jgi:hypothetical protein
MSAYVVDGIELEQFARAHINSSSRTLCLPGTRVDDLKNIAAWLMTPSKSNVLWLHGIGKEHCIYDACGAI